MVAALRRAAAALGSVVRFVTPLQYNRYGQGDHFEQLHLDEIAGHTAYKARSYSSPGPRALAPSLDPSLPVATALASTPTLTLTLAPTPRARCSRL